MDYVLQLFPDLTKVVVEPLQHTLQHYQSLKDLQDKMVRIFCRGFWSMLIFPKLMTPFEVTFLILY